MFFNSKGKINNSLKNRRSNKENKEYNMDYDYLAMPEIHTGRKKDLSGSDCTVPIDDGFINIRVGAIIKKDNKLLMVKNEKQDYLYSVGGRVKFGETSKEAVEREVYEETGTHMKVQSLGFVHENYFYADDKVRMNKVIYEISFYYYMEVPDDFAPVCNSFTEDESKESLEWIEIGSDKIYFPEFFRSQSLDNDGQVRYIVTNDIK